MKKILTLSLAAISAVALTSAAQAAKPGAYVGAGVGYSKLQTEDKYLLDVKDTPGFTQSRELGGFGGRVFGGYNLNQYFGVEAGLAHYAPSSYKSTISLSDGSSFFKKVDYSLNAFDLVGKAYLPLSDSGFNLYGLAGMAYVHSTTKVNDQIFTGDNATYNNNAIRPKFGVGVSYDIPQSNWGTSLEWSRIQGTGNVNNMDHTQEDAEHSLKDSKAIPNADMIALSVSYKFD